MAASSTPAPPPGPDQARYLALALKAAGVDAWGRARTLVGLGLTPLGAVDAVLAGATDGVERAGILWDLTPLLRGRLGGVGELLYRHRVPAPTFLFARRDYARSLRWMRELGLVLEWGDRVDAKGSCVLRLRGWQIGRELPAGLHMAWDLDLERCEDLEDLGPGLSVGRLRLEDCDRLRDLPPDLRCTSLDLRRCPDLRGLGGGAGTATEVRTDTCPSLDLSAGGPLHLTALTVHGPIGTQVLSPGSRIDRRLHLEGCPGPVTLPRGLRLDGDLGLLNCPGLTGLPADLTVGGSAQITGSHALRALPEALRIGQNLTIYDCGGLEELPPGLHIPGDLVLDFCGALHSLPPDLQVGGRLTLWNLPSLKPLPPALRVHPRLDLRSSPGAMWPGSRFRS